MRDGCGWMVDEGWGLGGLNVGGMSEERDGSCARTRIRLCYTMRMIPHGEEFDGRVFFLLLLLLLEAGVVFMQWIDSRSM